MNSETDGRKDFDFLHGRWKVHNRRLVRRLQACTEWQEFEASQDVRPVLGGLGNVDTYSALPFSDGKPLEGMTLRIFDPSAQTWSLYWADDRSCQLQPPVVGRFVDGRGEFSGDDVFDGKPIRVRFIWSHLTATSARWEQAFSVDGGETWETNWYMVMTRIG